MVLFLSVFASLLMRLMILLLMMILIDSIDRWMVDRVGVDGWLGGMAVGEACKERTATRMGQREEKNEGR